MKNFSRSNEVLVTTIPALQAQTGMIDYTFLLPGKNDLCKLHFFMYQAYFREIQRLSPWIKPFSRYPGGSSPG
jgi:hypothetical protein